MQLIVTATVKIEVKDKFSRFPRFQFWGIRTIALEENCPRIRVRVWIRVRVSFRVRGGGGNFPWGQFSWNPILGVE